MADTRGSVQVIDTHAHLDHERFRDDLDDVIARAKAAGVWPVIEVGSDLATSRAALGLVRRYPGLLAAVGIHPHEAKTASDAALETIRAMASEPGVVAIGEIGLDYHYHYAPPEVQRDVFRRQIDLARRLGLPVVVHDREAHEDIREMLTAGPGIIHCFSGDSSLAAQLIDRGFYISFAGNITFPAAAGLRQVAATVPLDKLLLETDCPYLAPVPYRGRTNEPAYVKEVAVAVAGLRGLAAEEVAATAAANTQRVVGRRLVTEL